MSSFQVFQKVMLFYRMIFLVVLAFDLRNVIFILLFKKMEFLFDISISTQTIIVLIPFQFR